MSNVPPESVRLARRLAYEDALLALGVSAAEASRRAAERYPRLPPLSRLEMQLSNPLPQEVRREGLR
jgi:hypothetical protein